jgi:NADPH oxidase 1
MTGHIMLLCMILLYTSAYAYIIQQNFEVFWYTHHLTGVLFVCLFLHAAGCLTRGNYNSARSVDSDVNLQHCFTYQSWRWEIVPFTIYIIDKIVRELRANRKTFIKSIKTYADGKKSLLYCFHYLCTFSYLDLIQISLHKPSLQFQAGQWVFLNVPQVSKYQWHPFTITSSPYDPDILLHIQVVGDFTRQIHQRLVAKCPIKIRVDGPYGRPALDVSEYDVLLLVATGVGITPWCSLLRSIWHEWNAGPRSRHKIELIWICQRLSTLEAFLPLLESFENCFYNHRDRNSFLTIRIYLTQVVNSETNAVIQLFTLRSSQSLDTTRLQSMTSFTRPHFPSLLDEFHNNIIDNAYSRWLRASDRISVGVVFCGSKNVGNSLRQACQEHTSDKVDFFFQQKFI